MIDPEFWSDEEIGSWSYAARLFYIGLWNFADDEGKFKAHDSLLRSQIFPYDKKIVIEKLKKELQSKIVFYSQNGAQYGLIRNFLKHQRIDHPTKSQLPNPSQEILDSSPNPHRILAPNISKVNIREVNLISTQIENLLISFNGLQEKVKTYIEENAKKNKTKKISDQRKQTLLLELLNAKERCNDASVFETALSGAVKYNACNIGYVNAIIKSKKTKVVEK